MKKILLFSLVLFFNIFITKVFLYFDITPNRSIASLSESFKYNCKEIVSFFNTSDSFNPGLYNKYYEHYKVDVNFDSGKKEFENEHDYFAWLDTYLVNQNVDLANYLLSNNRRHYLSLKKLNSKDLLSTLFNPLNSKIINKSIKINTGDGAVDYYIRKKLFAEAMSKIHAVDIVLPPSRWKRFFDSTVVTKLTSILSYAPILIGMPPLRLPKITSEAQLMLKASSTQSEVREVFKSMSKAQALKLRTNFYYDVVSKYYVYIVSTFYLYVASSEIVLAEESIDNLEAVNVSIDEIISDHKLLEVSCDSLVDCIEHYREDWESNKDVLYPIYRQSCIETYLIPRSCTD